MIRCIQPSLLLVGVEPRPAWETSPDVYVATTPREAISTMRLVDVDLLVVGLEDPQLDVWDLMQRVLTAWPRQHWVLVSGRVTAEEEVLARSLGALLVLHAVPDEEWLWEFAASLRRRELTKFVQPVVSGAVPMSHSA